MSKLSVPRKSDLSRAGWLLVVEFMGALIAAVVLTKAGGSVDYIFLCIWVFNLWPAWHLAKAASALGKSSVLYGLGAALLPVFAFFVWSRLHSAEFWQRLEQEYGGET